MPQAPIQFQQTMEKLHNQLSDKNFRKADEKTIAERKQAIERLSTNMQATVNTYISGYTFSSKFELAYQPLQGITDFAQQLVNTVKDLVYQCPDNDEKSDGLDDDLNELISICEALITGAARVREYLDAAKCFQSDLDKINKELWNKIQKFA
jgi:hypothetical protein